MYKNACKNSRHYLYYKLLYNKHLKKLFKELDFIFRSSVFFIQGL